MKIIFTSLLCFLLSVSAFSQAFNTGQTLKSGTFAVGVNPIFYDTGNDYDLGVYFHGGYGLKKNIDLNVKYGILKNTNYLGADLEFALLTSKPYISLIAGGHLMGNDGLSDVVGLDLGSNLTFPISSDLDIFAAIDLDMDFRDKYNKKHEKDGKKMYNSLWVPLGIEYKLNQAAFIFEIDVPANDNANMIIGGGFTWYFN